MPTPTATPLFGDDDPRYGTLTDAILATIYERGRGLLLVGVLGAIRLAEEQIVRENYDEAHGS